MRASASSQIERDAVAAIFIGAGAGGVQENGNAILTYLPDHTDFGALAERVRKEVPGVEIRWSHVGELPIDSSWIANVGIQRLGRLTVAPPWLADEAGAGDQTIVIEPATAFGTGDHPSTRLVLRLMQEVIRKGDRVADLGAGSGVLSIAAVKLGAAKVAAIEVDDGSIGNGEENIRRNGVADQVKVIQGDAAVILPLVSPVRVILANIIAVVIEALLPEMRDALTDDGQAVVGGVLLTERDKLVRALESRGWILQRELTEGDWWSGVIARR